MLSIIKSATSYGLKPIEIDVEVNIASKGFPGFSIVGMASKAVDEARERVKTAIVNSDIEFPLAKITVNMAPADLPKEGSYYDLPIAIGILQASEFLPNIPPGSYFYGELSLDGSLRHTKGVFLLALLAKEMGIKNIFIPRVSAMEACAIRDINIFPVSNLKELIFHITGTKPIEPLKHIPDNHPLSSLDPEFDFSEIYGQEQAKRALEIAAAGGHNILMTGTPGAGKTMLARALAGILPPLCDDESLEVTKIYSITGNIPPGGSLIRHRPFACPHHTISTIGLVGGGPDLRPGQVSLSHRGVLFLDEFPEFSRISLEALRQPMEDGVVTITRARGSVEFPCKFMLVAAANPCPCGYLGDTKHPCSCTFNQIDHYHKKISGPILDRIDMHLTIPSIEAEKIIGDKPNGQTSKEIAARVAKARIIQQNRFKNIKGVYTNSDMKNKHVKNLALLDPKALNLLKIAVSKYGFSARTFFRLIKVSRTIADLASSQTVLPTHTAEALSYRVKIEKS